MRFLFQENKLVLFCLKKIPETEIMILEALAALTSLGFMETQGANWWKNILIFQKFIHHKPEM